MSVKVGLDSMNETKNNFHSDDLLFMLGVELKRQLSSTLLASENSGNELVRLQTQRSIRTIDNVLLYKRLNQGQEQLDLSPVHVGAILTSVAHDMRSLTEYNNCDTEVYIQSGIKTVDTNSAAFYAGLTSLWQAMLQMMEKPSPIRWHVFKTKQGIRLSVTNNSINLEHVLMSDINYKAGVSSQPFQGLAGSATDLIAARGIFEVLGGTIRKVSREGQHGFGVTLRQSLQLSLV